MTTNLYDDKQQRWLYHDLLAAYYKARQNKRNTINQLQFEANLEANIYQLYLELKNRCYHLSPSIAFVIFEPKPREIFAATFRDRIVHHLIYTYISPYWEKRFIYDSYSCRQNKGTRFGARRMFSFLRSVTHNYSTEAWVMKLDISGYFMNMDKSLMWQFNKRILFDDNAHLPEAVKELLWYLLPIVIFADPTQTAIIKGSLQDWNFLPANKSLFLTVVGFGFPIGNLTSQLFSNIYLHELDIFIKQKLHIQYYGRYVDDFVLMHRFKNALLSARESIANFLKNHLHLNLHPGKVYLQPAKFGLPFIGVWIKPRLFVPGKRVKRQFARFLYLSIYCHQDFSWSTRWQSYCGHLRSYCLAN
ncbi:reverse transcriptase [bacterium]|nr:reverse transcriptase [bacterium]